jgi:hypothetical protein
MTRKAIASGSPWLALLLLAAPAVAHPGPPAGEEPLPHEAAAFVARALPDGAEQPGGPDAGRALFEQVLAGPLFERTVVGPFDVHVLADDELARGGGARRVLEDVRAALDPAAQLVARRWPEGGGGLVSATRLPIVIAEPGRDGRSWDELLSLLDHCERLGYSGWAPANAVDTPQARAAEVARTWEVQLYNLSHPTIADRRSTWLDRGVGYYALAFVAHRALRQGSWGLVPPWLAQGLTDELDIAAHGTAWVGQESWTEQTPGWFRPGWSGFVPQGARPPAPLTGPPADLAVTVTKTGDPWLDFEASATRHWTSLVADLKSEAPASFARAAGTQSFLPRDRAAARCLLALMLDVAPGPDGTLTALLDRPAATPPDGMPDADPLPVLFARALGGVPEVDRLEALDTRALLEELNRADLVARVEALGAAGLLELSDHREQSRWLYRRPEFDRAARGRIFETILEIEHAQQMAEWTALSPRLDRALAAALGAGRGFPGREREVAKVAEAFRTGLAADPSGQDDSGGSGKRSRSRARR